LSYSHNEVKPYHHDQSGKKVEVGKMFDNIAPHYDLLNRILSLGIDKSWRIKGINLLKKRNPKQVLDVATGTADVAIQTVELLQPDKVVGIDISTKMLEVGRKKVAAKNWSDKIELIEGDSEELPFEDNRFDAVTVAFGVRNYENLEKGLLEMNRVLKPGGQVMILELSRPTIFPFKQLYNFYFKYILPFIGKMTSKDPKAYEYLYQSVMAFPNGKDFVEVLNKTGYKNNKCLSLTLGICSLYIGEK